jgi:hypothetical protein
MRVTRQRKIWLEMHQRATQWFPWAIAAKQVVEPELKELILGFGEMLTKAA